MRSHLTLFVIALLLQCSLVFGTPFVAPKLVAREAERPEPSSAPPRPAAVILHDFISILTRILFPNTQSIIKVSSSSPSSPNANSPLSSLTTLYCVAAINQPTLQVRIFPNQSQCSDAAYHQLYNFIGFAEQHEGITAEPWSHCLKASGSDTFGVVRNVTDCSSAGWTVMAKGFNNALDTGLKSFIGETPDGHMVMGTTRAWKLFNYTIQHEIRHLAVLELAFPQDRGEAEAHISMYSSLYRPPTTKIESTKEELLMAQVAISSLPRIPAEHATLGRLQPDTIQGKIPHPDIVDQYQLHYIETLKSMEDHVSRRVYRLQMHNPDGRTKWMAEALVPEGLALEAKHVRSLFSESLRAFSLVRVEKAKSGNYLIISTPRGHLKPDIYAFNEIGATKE